MRILDVWVVLHNCSPGHLSISKCPIQHQSLPVCQSAEWPVLFQLVCWAVPMGSRGWLGWLGVGGEPSALSALLFSTLLSSSHLSCPSFSSSDQIFISFDGVFHHLWKYRQNLFPHITHSPTFIWVLKHLSSIRADLIQQLFLFVCLFLLSNGFQANLTPPPCLSRCNYIFKTLHIN